MALLEIRKYPDPVLRAPSSEVPEVNDSVRQLVDDMLETMVAAKGVGLAAPQVGQSLAIFVVDIWWPKTQSLDRSRVFINPKIIRRSGSVREAEGCLSFPGLEEYVDRAKRITVLALDREGQTFEVTTEGFFAVAIQHEYDHLKGLTILDHLGPFSRKRAVLKMVGTPR
jgi:peptide deformylase